VEGFDKVLIFHNEFATQVGRCWQDHG